MVTREVITLLLKKKKLKLFTFVMFFMFPLLNLHFTIYQWSIGNDLVDWHGHIIETWQVARVCRSFPWCLMTADGGLQLITWGRVKVIALSTNFLSTQKSSSHCRWWAQKWNKKSRHKRKWVFLFFLFVSPFVGDQLHHLKSIVIFVRYKYFVGCHIPSPSFLPLRLDLARKT